ncbi:MAG: adenylyltransferase/cytidyltransferase family protein [Lachnospiraceae bacterium]|nr:adenylyltransferase/cytidyltransferase family protein [Lachnospiraceae bacterium]
MMLKRGMTEPKLKEMVQDKSGKSHSEAEKIIMPALNKAREKYGKDAISYEDFSKFFPSFSEASNAHIKYIGNSVRMYDLESPYVNIQNGMRVSLPAVDDTNESDTTNIHFFGKSWIYGHHCSDEFTLPSFVQRLSNENQLNYHVYNHAVPGLREDKIANLMYEWNDKLPKDDVFVLIHMFEDYGNKFNEKVALETGYIHPLSSDRPHDYGEIWVDSGHIGEDGSELLARQVVDYITGNGKAVPGIFRNKFNSAAGREIYRYQVEDQASLWAGIPEFKEYQKYLAQYKQRIGSIVMNCNPFTLGHRYLIETAAAQCDKLYIFVVEEDKSIFPFEDRLKLVKEGVRDLENVTVLHSGNFIISALTFPGYFNKSVDNNVSVDTSDDLTLFARYIAPTLGITVRFAGEEPIDYITRQYNETMKEILPKYGMEFIEIPRKVMGESVISASRVRKLLKEDNFEEIRKIVPETTFDYLVNNKEKYR